MYWLIICSITNWKVLAKNVRDILCSKSWNRNRNYYFIQDIRSSSSWAITGVYPVYRTQFERIVFGRDPPPWFLLLAIISLRKNKLNCLNIPGCTSFSMKINYQKNSSDRPLSREFSVKSRITKENKRILWYTTLNVALWQPYRFVGNDANCFIGSISWETCLLNFLNTPKSKVLD